MGKSLSPEALEFERVRCYVSSKSRISCVTLLFLCSAAMLLTSTTCFADCAWKTVPDIERDASPPKNSAQLLRNLKLAFDRGSLLDPEFFSDNNLIRFFNGTSVRWHVLTPPDMYVADITTDPSLVGIKEISVRTWKNGAPLLDGAVRIEVDAASELTLGGVRKVFGREIRTVFPEAPSHPMAANADIPTTPFGIEYVKTTPSVGSGCRVMRAEAKFSADVHSKDWYGLRLHGPNPERLPDQPMVISISLKATTE